MVWPSRIVAMIVLGLLVFLAGSLYADPAGRDREPTPAELLQRINALEARVATLEGRAFLPHAVAPQVPKDWGVKEFNGGYYYIVPLHMNPR
jgi:hypothetical protein